MGEDINSGLVCGKCGTRADVGLIFCKECGTPLVTPRSLVAPAPKSPQTNGPVIADAIGLILVAVQVALLFWWLVPNDGTRLMAGILAYGVLIAVALGIWHGKQAEMFSDAYDLVGVFFGSILLGGMSFGVDVLIGSSEYPNISPIRAGTKVGSPFGFMLTIFLCPGVTTIAVASLVRSFLLRGQEDT